VVVVAHVQVGGVPVDEGKLGVVKPAAPEGGHVVVEVGADAADLVFGNPVPIPRAWTSSSTARVDMPCT
jgi:hypothetical protein